MNRFLAGRWVIPATVLALSTGQLAAASDTLTIFVDQATIAKLPEKVATIIVGNPLIADVAVQPGGMMVLTGKGYGVTNLVALDRAGNVLLEKAVQVQAARDNVVVVYRGVERETYSCQPRCERRITLGDGADYFTTTIGQSAARNTMAQGAAPQNR